MRKRPRTIKLSKYLADTERKWRDTERANAKKLIEYLNQRIDVDLFKMAKTRDSLEVYHSLNGWLFNFYYQELLDGLSHIGYDVRAYLESLVNSLVIAVTRGRPNAEILHQMLVARGVIDEIGVYEDDIYEIRTKNFGEIRFCQADRYNDLETEQYLASLGERIIDGCHEISFHMIEKDVSLKAVTAICTKGLGCKYYHSFILDRDNNVIDLTTNLVMPKEDYYRLQKVEELNVTNYQKYLQAEQESIKFDESGTLYGLLRNALYRQLAESEPSRS